MEKFNGVELVKAFWNKTKRQKDLVQYGEARKSFAISVKQARIWYLTFSVLKISIILVDERCRHIEAKRTDKRICKITMII